MNARLLAACLIFHALPATAHHSRAHFDQDRTIEIRGVVTEVSWRSPHVYVQVTGSTAGGAEQVWTFEGHSIPGFLRVGWQRDSVVVGDRVVVVAHPNRDATKPFAMLYSATLDNGRTFYAYAIPDGVTIPDVPDRASTTPSTDFSGTWRHIVPVRFATIDSYRAPTEWPLTARGRTQAEAFDINDDPVLDCVPMGVPRLILATYSHRFTRLKDRILIEKERYGQLRTIYLDGRSVPDDFVADELGFSTGTILADGTLVVRTTHFAPTRWGNARGLDSSAEKSVVERYRLSNEGFSIDVEYTITDPVYLAEPVTLTGVYTKSADFEFVEEACDSTTARRHLQF